MRYDLIVPLCLVMGAVCTVPSNAANNSVGAKVSTLGAGIEYERQFNELFGMRMGVNYFQYDGDFTVDDIKYDTDVDLQTASALLDWYPFSGAFRLTGGVMYNGNEGDFSATPASPVTVGDVVFTPAQIGTLNGSVTFNSVAPYVGLGWSSGRDNKAGLSVSFDVGVLFQGAPNVEDYYATGLANSIPGFQAQLDREAAKIEDELDPYQYYPVVALTLMYRF